MEAAEERVVADTSKPASFAPLCARWVATAKVLHPALPRFADLNSAAATSLRETDARQIDTDLHRSNVSTLELAEEKAPAHRECLRRLLRAWCVLRPDWGYSQAMNFPAAVALVVANHKEADAFAIFVALVHRLPPDFFAEVPPLRGFQAELATLTALLEARLPALLEVADGAIREALPLVACKWFLNIFVETLPLPSLLAVWDLLLCTDSTAVSATPSQPRWPSPSSPSSPPPPPWADAAPGAAPGAVAGAAADAAAGVDAAAVAMGGAGPTDGLLRVALALLESHATSLLDTLDTSPPPDASVAYAALLQLGGAVSRDELMNAIDEVVLPAEVVEALRAGAREEFDAADAAEATTRGRTSWAPATPSRLRDQQHLLKMDELLRLKVALARAAEGDGSVWALREEGCSSPRGGCGGCASGATSPASSMTMSSHGAASSGSLGGGGGSGSGSGGSGDGPISMVDEDGCPRTNGGVGREAFGRVLLATTPMIVDAGLRVYDVLRTHSDGTMLPKVPWRELTAALATALRGSLTERLQLVFRLFDPAAKGEIDVAHMMAMASMLFKLRLLDPTAADRPIVAAKSARRAASRRLSTLTTSPDLLAAARYAKAGGVGRASVATPATLKTPLRALVGAATRERTSSAPEPDVTDITDLSRPVTEGARPVLTPSGTAGGGRYNPSVTADDDRSSRRSMDSDADGTDPHADAGWSEADSSRLSDGGGRLSLDLGAPAHRGAMSRSTAPVSSLSPAPSKLQPIGWGSARATHNRHRRGSANPAPRPSPLTSELTSATEPRLRRMATVCGGERYEQVTEQVNELLQLLLVMDVDRTGSLSYVQWTRGVLCLPEVLGCFQLSSVVAQPPPPSNDPLFARYHAVQQPSVPSDTAAVATTRDSAAALGVARGLWWRSVWRSLAEGGLCTACGR